MPTTTAEREKRLTDALDDYHACNSPVSLCKIAKKHKVDRTTLQNQLHGKHSSITSNGGLNKLLAVAQLGTLFLYI
jgi:hypothetical protein